MSSKYPTSSSGDAASISNQPLVAKTSDSKDYEAAAATLMSSYGVPGGGGMNAAPTPAQKQNNKVSGAKVKASAGESNKAGQSSAPTSSTTPAAK